jgi:hypothetical protein
MFPDAQTIYGCTLECFRTLKQFSAISGRWINFTDALQNVSGRSNNLRAQFKMFPDAQTIKRTHLKMFPDAQISLRMHFQMFPVIPAPEYRTLTHFRTLK